MCMHIYMLSTSRESCIFVQKHLLSEIRGFLSGSRNTLIYNCLCGMVGLPCLFRVTERALLTCGRGCLAVRYGLCHGGGRAFRECRTACSGFPNVLRRCSGVVFRGILNVIMGVWSGVRRFSVICFTKNGCQNILLPHSA